MCLRSSASLLMVAACMVYGIQGGGAGGGAANFPSVVQKYSTRVGVAGVRVWVRGGGGVDSANEALK